MLDAQHVQHKIRLAGIDAPEKAQPFGNVSRQHLASLIFDREVVVDAGKTDRYGRTVGRVLVSTRRALDIMVAPLTAAEAGLRQP